jgi:hypothetical protein
MSRKLRIEYPGAGRLEGAVEFAQEPAVGGRDLAVGYKSVDSEHPTLAQNRRTEAPGAAYQSPRIPGAVMVCPSASWIVVRSRKVTNPSPRTRVPSCVPMTWFGA